MAGYLPDEATAEAFADGWYRTGDVGWLEPEGWVHLTDRSQGDDQGQRLPGGPGRDRGGAARPPRGARLRGVRCGRRAGRRGAGRRRAARPGRARRRRRARRQLVADSLATYKQLRHVVVVDDHPAAPVGQGAAAHAPRRVDADSLAAPPRTGATDGRPPLRRAAGPARLGRPARRPARSTYGRPARRRRAGGEARRRRRPPRAGASCGSPSDDGAPLASGVEAAIVAEELGRGLADVAFLGPTLAAELRRLAGAPPAATAETVALDARPLGAGRGRSTAGCRRRGGHRRPGAAVGAGCWCRGPTAPSLAESVLPVRRRQAST